MRKLIYVGALLAAVAFVIWLRGGLGPRKAITLTRQMLSLQVLVDPYAIPEGSCLSVMDYNDDLGACIKNLPSAHVSTGGNSDAIEYLKQCPKNKEAWLVGHGNPGKIATADRQKITIADGGGFEGFAASKLVLFACWTGAKPDGADLVNGLQSHTHGDVWAQNSEAFCVPHDDTHSQLYLYHDYKPIEATPTHAAPEVEPDLFNDTPDSIVLSDSKKVIHIPRQQLLVVSLVSVASGPFDKKEFSVSPEDRRAISDQFLKVVNFSSPFKASAQGRAAIPLARPIIKVVCEIDGKPRNFTVYGGGLLGDDGSPDTFYLMNSTGFQALATVLENKYRHLFE
jgi:hypothetical protein